ncbi:hypothetical protein ACLI4Z_11410 [Natrialbaceae archaeon A-arb3/5]
MDFDRSDHEPAEEDPEAEFRDPESDSLTIPRVQTEDAGSGLKEDLKSDLEHESVDVPTVSTDPSDVPKELRRTFWAIVLVVNGAVLSFSLGVIFIVFQGVSTHSLALLAGGIVLFGSAVRRYRAYERDHVSEEAEPETDDRVSEDVETDTEDDASARASENNRTGDENANELKAGETTSRDLTQGRSPDESDRS